MAEQQNKKQQFRTVSAAHTTYHGEPIAALLKRVHGRPLVVAGLQGPGDGALPPARASRAWGRRNG